MKLILRLAINVFALLIVATLVPGFNLDNIWTAVVTAVVFGVINTFIRPILQIIALPVSLLTLGLAAFLINVLLLYATSYLVPGFTIDTFLTAMMASILLSLVSWFLNHLAS